MQSNEDEDIDDDAQVPNVEEHEQQPPRRSQREQEEAAKRICKCKDHYQVLGVTNESTDTDVKNAYKKLARQFHPDKNNSASACEAFKTIGKAYAVLSDAEKRRNYDLYGPMDHQQRVSNYGTRFEFDNIQEVNELIELFNRSFAGGNVYVHRNPPQRHSDGENFAHAMFILLVIVFHVVWKLFKSIYGSI